MENISQYFFKQQPTGFSKKYKYFKLDNTCTMNLEVIAASKVESLENNNWNFVGFEGDAPIFEDAVTATDEDYQKHSEVKEVLNEIIK